MKLRLLFFILLLVSAASAQSPIVTKDATAVVREYREVIGILGAFDEEIKFLLTKVEQQEVQYVQQVKFVKGVLRGKKVVVAQTGIGKVNAAIATTLMIEHFQPSAIIFTGIAGGTNPELMPGDLVIGKRVAHHDYGTIRKDSMEHRPTRNPFSMQENPIYYESDPSLIKLASDAATGVKLEKVKSDKGDRSPRIIVGTIVTGDVFVSSDELVRIFRKRFNADATEMEGAAVAQVCLQQAQPLIVIRSLSDNAGSKAGDEVRAFYQLAARNSANLVIEMVGRR